MKNISTSIGVFFFIFTLVSVGCKQAIREEEWLDGTIESVKVITSLKEEADKIPHPFLGASLGGLVAGIPGAMVGAVLGSRVLEKTGQEQKQITNEIVSCRFVVKLKEGTIVAFTYPYGFIIGLSQCATLREGDKIKIAKVKYKGESKITYWWRINPYSHPRGELIPN